ncbi:MAG TPA: condensation domain-containing protein, partial [Candidatus Binatus sp.]|nr:condensation domain-containing protein [Candidatus Binatus sp.]
MATESLKGARQNFIIDKALTARLKELSARSRTTLFVTLMAAFKILLTRHTHQEDLIIGFPVANRDAPELENLIGSFVNTLALRSDLSGNPTFTELLGRLRVAVQEALVHQELPFERLVDELKQSRDASRTPVFQSLFTFQNRLPAQLSLPGIHAQPIDCDSGGAKFDLSLALGERDGRLSGFFEYRSALFADHTIARMVGHFVGLLKGIVADPARPIARLPLISASERRRLLFDWNQTRADLPKSCAHQLFEARVKRAPTRIAVECGGDRLTYAQLNRRANRLARYLKGLGAGRESIIGICLERSAEMVVALLAVLKAGAAYLPLDPHYPAGRLTAILTDAQVSLLLTEKTIVQSGRLSSLPAFTTTLCLDEDRREVAKGGAENISTAERAADLAYVIYTSGSTGVPKGVQIEHRSLVN